MEERDRVRRGRKGWRWSRGGRGGDGGRGAGQSKGREERVDGEMEGRGGARGGGVWQSRGRGYKRDWGSEWGIKEIRMGWFIFYFYY